MAIAVQPPDYTEQEEQGILLVAQAEDLGVVDQATFERAAEMLKTIKAYLAEVKRITAPVVTAAHAAWKAALAQQQGLEANALEAEKILKKALGEYEAVQRAEAEKIRREMERVQREAEQAAKAKAKETGAPVQAVVVFTPPPPPVPKAQGVAFTDVWKFQIMDAAAVPEEYKIVDEKRVGAVVRALKGQTQINGVRVYCER